MKFLLVFCFMVLVSNAAATQDLSSKMFVFPEETDTAYVKLTLPVERLSAVTVCHRTFTELKRSHVLFPLDVPNTGGGNGLVTFLDQERGIEANVLNTAVYYNNVDYPLNKWNSMCTTWSSASGVVQMWLNEQPLTIRYITETPITGRPIVTFGQEQDSYGGSFDAKQSFVGMMTDVHLWDRVLSPCEIQRFMKDQSFTPGNVLNWANLDFEIKGRVLIENKQMGCTC